MWSWPMLGVLTICLQLASTLFPYGPTAGDVNIKVNTEINLNPPLAFYGKTRASILIDPDGFLTFDGNKGDVNDIKGYTETSSVSFPAISVWSADMTAPDGTLESGNLYYRLSTDTAVLARLSTFVSGYSDFPTGYAPDYALIVTWDAVGARSYVTGKVDRVNSFQAVIASDGVNSLVLFDYLSIEWVYDGSPSLYDYYADPEEIPNVRVQIGFFTPDGPASFLLPVSGSNDVLYMPDDTNAGQNGLYAFRVDETPTNLTTAAEVPTTTTTATTATTTTTTTSAAAAAQTTTEPATTSAATKTNTVVPPTTQATASTTTKMADTRIDNPEANSGADKSHILIAIGVSTVGLIIVVTSIFAVCWRHYKRKLSSASSGERRERGRVSPDGPMSVPASSPTPSNDIYYASYVNRYPPMAHDFRSPRVMTGSGRKMTSGHRIHVAEYNQLYDFRPKY